jgi:hypothetical protein
MMTHTKALKLEDEKKMLERKGKLTSEEQMRLMAIKQDLHNYYNKGQKKKKKKAKNSK